jgi:hypothetical protein
VIADGVHATDTAGTSVTVADPDLVGSCVEVAVQVEVPALVGVSTPVEVILPPVAVQVTALL